VTVATDAITVESPSPARRSRGSQRDQWPWRYLYAASRFRLIEGYPTAGLAQTASVARLAGLGCERPYLLSGLDADDPSLSRGRGGTFVEGDLLSTRGSIPPRPSDTSSLVAVVPGRSHGFLDSCWLVGEISAGNEDAVWKSCDRERTGLFVTRHDKESAAHGHAHHQRWH
jgi:hypothetical protein